MTTELGHPVSPPPLRALRPEALPAYLSNGLVGLRVERLPLLGGSTVVSGYSGRNPKDGVASFAQAPYPFYGDIQIGDTWLSRAATTGRFVEQRHDFETGELSSRWQFELEGVGVELDHVAFCSRTMPTVVVHEIAIRLDRPAKLAIRSGVQVAAAPGRRLAAETIPDGTEASADVLVHWRSLGDLGELGIAHATEWVGPEAGKSVILGDERAAVSTTYQPRTAVESEVRLRTFVSFVPSYSHEEPGQQAARLAARARSAGFDRMRAANRHEWQELWQGRIAIDGASARWQALTDASLYYLLASVHRATPASTSLFGLAYWPNYHYYHGHVMWDLDTFVIPPLTLLQPDGARALLDFRRRTLSAAQQNAALNGDAGALYPWEASPGRGTEATPLFAPLRKDHVTIDVGLAAVRYLQATGDDRFAHQGGLEMVTGVADWIASRTARVGNRLVIADVTGPAETTTPVANDVWTNTGAVTLLRHAIHLARRSGIEPPLAWDEVVRDLVIPLNPDSRVLENHDDYRLDEDKGGTPEGAAAIFPLGWPATDDVERATFAYAVDEQAARYIGTPMLSSFFGVWAARLGRREQAMDLLERGYGAFADDPFLAVDEFPAHERAKPRANPMFANIGGYLTSLIFGFPALGLSWSSPSEWVGRPATMPEGWHSIAVERLWVRQRPMRLVAEHGRPARLAPLE